MNESLRVTTNPNYNKFLTAIKSPEDIPARWQRTPIAQLIGAQNFDEEIRPASEPVLLVATCIEFRFQPRVPSFYAYVVRRAGGRLLGAEFTVAYAIAKGVRHIALIGHNDCGMTKVDANSQAMIQALVGQGWPEQSATDFVKRKGPIHAIPTEVDALKTEYLRLRGLFRHVEIAPLFTALANNKLYIPNWYAEIEQENLSLPPVTSEDIKQLP